MTQQKYSFSPFFKITRDALETERAKRFLYEWILANLLGWLIAIILAFVSFRVVFGFGINGQELTFTIENGQIVFNLFPVFPGPAQLGNDGILLWLGALFGEVLGIAQWLVLRRYFSKAYYWLLVTSWGWILGSFIATAWLNLESYDSVITLPLTLIVANSLFLNLVVSLTQCLLIKRDFSRGREWFYWIYINIIGIILVALFNPFNPIVFHYQLFLIILPLLIFCFLIFPVLVFFSTLRLAEAVQKIKDLLRYSNFLPVKLFSHILQALALIKFVVVNLYISIFKSKDIIRGFVLFIFFWMLLWNMGGFFLRTELLVLGTVFMQSILPGFCLIYFLRDDWD